MIEEKISENSALEFFNKGKKRIRKINDNLWLIEDFFKFQYGTKFNTLNKMHIGIGKIYSENGIKLETLRGVERVSIPSKRSTESV